MIKLKINKSLYSDDIFKNVKDIQELKNELSLLKIKNEDINSLINTYKKNGYSMKFVNEKLTICIA